jgi:hypothetical protein
MTDLVRSLSEGAAAALGLQTPTAPTRGLLQDTPAPAPLPNLPANFDASAFRGAINNALLGAASSFGNSAIAAVNGRPGASAVLPAMAVLQKYVGDLQGVSGTLEKLLGGLPLQGKLLSVILEPNGGKTVLDSLTALSANLKTAGKGDQGAILGQIANVLGALVTKGTGGDVSPAVQAALQAAAKLVLPNAQKLLSGWVGQLAGVLASGLSG